MARSSVPHRPHARGGGGDGGGGRAPGRSWGRPRRRRPPLVVARTARRSAPLPARTELARVAGRSGAATRRPGRGRELATAGRWRVGAPGRRSRGWGSTGSPGLRSAWCLRLSTSRSTTRPASCSSAGAARSATWARSTPSAAAATIAPARLERDSRSSSVINARSPRPRPDPSSPRPCSPSTAPGSVRNLRRSSGSPSSRSISAALRSSSSAPVLPLGSLTGHREQYRRSTEAQAGRKMARVRVVGTAAGCVLAAFGAAFLIARATGHQGTATAATSTLSKPPAHHDGCRACGAVRPRASPRSGNRPTCTAMAAIHRVRHHNASQPATPAVTTSSASSTTTRQPRRSRPPPPPRRRRRHRPPPRSRPAQRADRAGPGPGRPRSVVPDTSTTARRRSAARTGPVGRGRGPSEDPRGARRWPLALAPRAGGASGSAARRRGRSDRTGRAGVP